MANKAKTAKTKKTVKPKELKSETVGIKTELITEPVAVAEQLVEVETESVKDKKNKRYFAAVGRRQCRGRGAIHA